MVNGTSLHMQLPFVAIFFITHFYRAGGGGHGPLAPLHSLLERSTDSGGNFFGLIICQAYYYFNILLLFII